MKKAPRGLKAKKMSAVFITIIIVIFTLLIFTKFFGTRFYQNSDYINSKVSIEDESAIYSSPTLNINFTLPSGFTPEEQINRVILTSKNGQIVVEKINTNFDNLNNYLVDISKKNNLEVVESDSLMVDGVSVKKVQVRNPRSNVVESWYLFYPTEWTIYTLSTNSESLYDDLDQIARSFRYIP
ncbi:MAG: hypothetical protein HYV40_01825 [Candidatus Levybacteria bacterium]|nr:hypothetical protein [Candidatus Levybacteria bacterium]